MSLSRLVLRSVTYHWRTNLAVVLGVAAAVSVLGGALLVGDSVRGSLRDLVLSRLGRTDDVVASAGFFRDALAKDLVARGVPSAAPLIAARAFVTHEPSGRRATSVLVYGVDERFWKFHGVEPHDGVFVSPALGAELGVSAGDVLLTRLQKPTDIPLESLFAHKEDLGRTVRLTVSGALPANQLGEFALQPQQTEVRAVFAPLRRLQRDLDVADQVNTILVGGTGTSSTAKSALRDAVNLEDLSVKVSVVADGQAVIVESAGGVVNEALEQAVLGAARELGRPTMPLFTYLANTIRVRDRQVPYSLVAGIDLRALPAFESGPPGSDQGQTGVRPGSDPRLTPSGERPDLGAPLRVMPNSDGIVLNEWTARELGARPGDPLTLEYYLWDAAAGLRTATADFTVAGIVPFAGLAADPRLAPEYPGITQTESLADWDPPFPLDLSRVRPQDEKYLGRPSHDAQGVSPLRARPRVVGDPLRECHRFSLRGRAGRGCRAARDSAAPEPAAAPRAGFAGRDARVRSSARARGIVRRDRFRRVLHLLQLLHRRLGAVARGAVLPPRDRAAAAPDRRPARDRIHAASLAVDVLR